MGFQNEITAAPLLQSIALVPSACRYARMRIQHSLTASASQSVLIHLV